VRTIAQSELGGSLSLANDPGAVVDIRVPLFDEQ